MEILIFYSTLLPYDDDECPSHVKIINDISRIISKIGIPIRKKYSPTVCDPSPLTLQKKKRRTISKPKKKKKKFDIEK